MKTLRVQTTKPYQIYVGANLLDNLPRLLRSFPSRKAFVISDSKLKEARKKLLKSLRTHGWEVQEIPVKAGESLKHFKNIYPIYGDLIKKGAKRDSLIIALGGGSVGDVAGFIAATYLRGVSWVGLPTTLLAQVDSSVGGKTGINHTLGKNLIGAFHQPLMVLCDVKLLNTLSNREMISGLGEAIKYALVYDNKLFGEFQTNWSKVMAMDSTHLEDIVFKSLYFKAQAVAKDEKDLKGIREFLNFGHTFGHALEAVTHYKKFQHGEAVIWGMRFALALSVIRKKLSEEDYRLTDKFLKSITVPKLPKIPLEILFKSMQNDKKIKNGKINFVLLKKIGKALSDNQSSLVDLREAARLMGVRN